MFVNQVFILSNETQLRKSYAGVLHHKSNAFDYKNISTAPKKKFSINDFFIKCDQTHRKLWIWSLLLKTS